MPMGAQAEQSTPLHKKERWQEELASQDSETTAQEAQQTTGPAAQMRHLVVLRGPTA